MHSGIKAIICDFDGTLWDSYVHGLEKVAIVWPMFGLSLSDNDWDRIHAEWGAPIPKLLTTLYPDMSQETNDAICAEFDEIDIRKPPKSVAGVRETLELLRARGIVFTILSSRDTMSLRKLLVRESLEDHFHHIVGLDLLTHKKPDKRAFDCTMTELAKLGIKPGECLMIGDTNHDLEAGRNLGIRTVLVRTGPFGRFDLPDDLDPAHAIHSFADLPKLLAA